jgi:hypothetical protein
MEAGDGESGELIVGRPLIPGYGVPESDEGMLAWSHVTGRLEQARNYWICTAGPDGQPHAVPVWGAWLDGALYFGVGPRSARNLTTNPKVAVHLESGDDVVILEGSVGQMQGPDPALSQRLDDAMADKYGWRPSEEGAEEAVGEGWYVLHPRTVYAWASFPQDATRWKLAPVG